MDGMNWMLMDMNSYFASVEQHLRPELRGRPVGVIPLETDSTCIIAASYDAKRFGVKTGTGVREARLLCPGVILVKARPDVYVRVHRHLLESVEKCTPIQRVYSIDEWTIQLVGRERNPEQAVRLGQGIKRQVLQDFGPWLTCSIGIAPTRLLAKLASNLQKPDGLTLLSTSDLPDRIEHLSLKDLSGIGDGMAARFAKHGIHTIRQLWELSREGAIRVWGSVTGARWWAGFHGYDEPEPPTRRQSMSHGNVLEPRFRHEEGARCILLRLVCKLGERLRRAGYLAGCLQLFLKDVRGHCFSGSIDLPLVQDTPTLLSQFEKLWRTRVPNRCPIKAVEVCVGKLVLASQVPRSLFDEFEKPHQLSRTIDKINEHFGSAAIYFGAVHNYRHRMENKIAFGRIPDEP